MNIAPMVGRKLVSNRIGADQFKEGKCLPNRVTRREREREREREVTWHCAKTVGRRDSDFDPMNYILSRSLLLR